MWGDDIWYPGVTVKFGSARSPKDVVQRQHASVNVWKLFVNGLQVAQDTPAPRSAATVHALLGGTASMIADCPHAASPPDCQAAQTL
jgi:hypothetical protein